ncbi:EF-hand domain-containing protein [Saccharopolyspora sp. SCSIO 74807]|uniref:EF-hand domain-containing protein n=1 Tax=Saccharopolyspora sp. SCSIO 74807 TaxID=3118084 RepID=UPI0030D5520F
MSTALATERLRKRFAKWDIDGSGSLERADLEKEGEKIAQAFGKSPTSPEGQAMRSAFTTMFGYLADNAGVGADGALTEDDFVRVAQKMMFEDGETAFDGVLGPVVRGIVGLCDKNADGQINGAEFASWLTAVGVDRSQASGTFAQVDANGNGELSVDELLAAVRDFHFGRSEIELLG